MSHSQATKNKIAFSHFGRIYSPELREHNRQAILRPEVRLEKSLSRKGEKSHFWKGGKTEAGRIARESFQYDEWRLAVFKRDGYACVECGKSKCFLNADHIKPFAFYPDIRFDVSNGRTLCVPCHKKTDTFGRRADKSIREAGAAVCIVGSANADKQYQLTE